MLDYVIVQLITRNDWTGWQHISIVFFLLSIIHLQSFWQYFVHHIKVCDLLYGHTFETHVEELILLVFSVRSLIYLHKLHLFICVLEFFSTTFIDIFFWVSQIKYIVFVLNILSTNYSSHSTYSLGLHMT